MLASVSRRLGCSLVRTSNVKFSHFQHPAVTQMSRRTYCDVNNLKNILTKDRSSTDKSLIDKEVIKYVCDNKEVQSSLFKTLGLGAAAESRGWNPIHRIINIGADVTFIVMFGIVIYVYFKG